MIILGVDIGGTKIATGFVNFSAGSVSLAGGAKSIDAGERPEISGASVTPTRAAEGFEVSIAQVWRAISEVLDGNVTRVEAIGICAPGPLNVQTGTIINPPNLPGWRDVPLARMAREKFGLRVGIENDCNAAALAEAKYGAGRGHAIVFYAAIGTGIGAGIVFNGKLYRGAHDAAGEAGHVTVDYRSSTICVCGSPGCIEAIASGSAMARAGTSVDGHADALASWLAGIVNLLDPGIIVLSGGVLSGPEGEPLLSRLRELVPGRTVNPHAADIPIVPAHFGVQAGLVGAAMVGAAAVDLG